MLTSASTHCLTCSNLLSVIIKVGMVGDSQIGKTSLMVRYVEGSFNEDYIQTLGTSETCSSLRPAPYVQLTSFVALR